MLSENIAASFLRVKILTGAIKPLGKVRTWMV